MTSKVEALRAEIGTDFRSFATFQVVDALISAAHAEGVAEGAEQVKSEIRKRSEHYHGDPTVEGGSYYVVLDAVLAPTKESTYAECLRDSVTDIINGEDIDPTPD